MGFAEQIAARAAETAKKQSYNQNRSHHDNKYIDPIATSPRPAKINNICRDINDGILNNGGSSTSLFAEQLKQQKEIIRRREDHFVSHEDPRSGNFGSTTTRKKSDRAAFLNNSIVVGDQQHDATRNSILESSPTLFQQSSTLVNSPLLSKTNNNVDSPWVSSQSTMKKVAAAAAAAAAAAKEDGMTRSVRLVHTPHQQHHTRYPTQRAKDDEIYDSANQSLHASSCDFSTVKNEENEDDRNDLEYASVGLSFMDASTASTVGENLSPQEQSKPEPQSKIHRQFIHSSQSSSKWGQPTRDSVKTNNVTGKLYSGNDDEASKSENSTNSVFGAWTQIEQLKRRVRDAEELARQERLRAENVSFELKLIKQGQHHHHHQGNGSWSISTVGGDCIEDITTAIQSAESVKILDDPMKTMREGRVASSEVALQRKNHDSESDDCLETKGGCLKHSLELAAAATSPTTATSANPESKIPNCFNPCTFSYATSTAITPTPTALLATSSHLEEIGMILRLKNAEIDVLRSQVRRLEQRIHEGRDRNINEDLMLTQSYHYDSNQLIFGDALPLGVASECMMAHSTSLSSRKNTPQMDELYLLRHEVRKLQYQLRVKDRNSNGAGGGGATTTSTGGSTLSSLEGPDNNFCRNDVIDEVVEGEEGGNSSSSPWGLCCFRGRRRRGYGRV